MRSPPSSYLDGAFKICIFKKWFSNLKKNKTQNKKDKNVSVQETKKQILLSFSERL